MMTIIYEDQDIIAVEKPDQIASIPERGTSAGSVSEALSSLYDQRIYIVHRLDKEVSGVLLFARNPEAHRYLNLQFTHRRVRKTYTGLVWGNPSEKSGRLEYPIRPFGSGRMGVDADHGKPSLTKFETMRRLQGFTLLNLHPVTGRRHQIRVHLYAFGHPLAGDRRYGDRRQQERFPRLMLHASSVSLKLPDGNSITIRSELPDSFTGVISTLEL